MTADAASCLRCRVPWKSGDWEQARRCPRCRVRARARELLQVVLKKTPRGEQRASLKDTHELFTPSDKRGNESDREMEAETKGWTDGRTDRQEGPVGDYINSDEDDRHP